LRKIVICHAQRDIYGAQVLPDQSPLVVAGLAAGALCSWSSAVLRRSLSFMLIGVLIAVPILLTANAAQTDWPPHKIVLIAVVTVASACIMALVERTRPR
jgi:hypothetical protein